MRERRHCKRCDRGRIFNVRIKANGTRQSDCVACARRRGRGRSPAKISYRCMKQRCLNPSAGNYRYYGGKGVAIDPRWLGDGGFDRFVEDMGERPTGKTLDRIDVDGPYSAENCRWATYKEQVANRGVNGEAVLRHCTYGTRKKKNYEQTRQG